MEIGGWFAAVHETAGKTEVRAGRKKDLARLAEAFGEVPRSEIYPSFARDRRCVLFFRATDPDFLRRLEAYFVENPIDRPKRRSAAPLVASALVLVALVATLAAVGAAIWSEANAPRRPRPALAASSETPAAALDETPAVAPAPPGAPGETPPVPSAASAPPEAEGAPSAPPVPPGGGRLVVAFVDVGQGDGTVVKLPAGACAVVDANAGGVPRDGAGDRPARLPGRPVRRREPPAPRPHRGSSRDRPAGTGPRLSTIRATPTRRGPTGTSSKRSSRRTHGYIQPRPGDRLDWDPSVEVVVLSADAAARDPNDASIVLRLGFGRTAAILTGDAERAAERRMVARFGTLLRADLLKVGHHGSRSSSSPLFLDAVRPRYAVVSCGRWNPYGHPHAATLEALAARGVEVFRTDRDGTIVAMSDGASFTVRKGLP